MSIENRRQAPRIPINLQASVINYLGISMHAEARDLSLKGVALIGGEELVGHIEAIDEETGNTFFPVEINTHIRLDDGTQLELACREVYKRRLSQNRFQLGFKITGFSGDSKQNLSDYINRNLD